MKQFPGRSGQSIDRKITGEDDRDRIKDRPIHIFRRRENNLIQLVVLALTQRQFAVNVFDHYHRAVDDDAEVDGADRKQIRRYVMRVKHDEGKQQRQWNGQRDNDGRAKADQEKDQNDQHQHHAAKQVVLNRIGRQIDQVAAVVIGMNLDVGRQNLAIQFLCLGLHSFEYVLRLLAAQHEDDAFDCVVIFLKAEFS